MSTLNTTNIKHTANTGDPNLVLDPAGDVAINGKATSVSTNNADDGETLATKDYVDANSMRGGVGADAWGMVSADGTLVGGFNIASVVKSGISYTYTFTTPMPDANYAVVATENDTGGGQNTVWKVTLKTPTGFTTSGLIPDNSGAWTGADGPHGVVVHATTTTVRLAYPYGSTSTVDSRLTAIEARLNQLEGGSF